MIIFAADDPLVRNGTYDQEGFTPKERRALTRKQQQGAPMAKHAKALKEESHVTITGPDGESFSATGDEFQAAVHRLTTLPSNGDAPESREVAPQAISVGEAMRQAVAALGERTTDVGLSAGQLAELADCYEHVIEATAAYAQKADAAKVAKKAVESATEFLLERIKAYTHGASLPLFDATQAEQDVQAMTEAGASGV